MLSQRNITFNIRANIEKTNNGAQGILVQHLIYNPSQSLVTQDICSISRLCSVLGRKRID